MSGAAIRLHVADDGVAEVVLAQPQRGNPFDAAFCSELRAAAIECDENPAVRAVLIRAEGPYFSVGADLKWLGSEREPLSRKLKTATADLHMAVSRLSRGDAPVVIAVHALCTGGATALTAMADFALAAPEASFYAAYNAIGFVSDGGGTYFLPRRLGSRKAMDFVMLNQRWSAAEALAHGLISRVVEGERLDAEARDLARHLAQGPTRTYGEMRRLMIATFDTPLETQLEMEARAIARCARTDDAWNAIQAVRRKQQPVFEGR